MLRRLLPFLSDKEYMAGLSTIAVPIIFQQAISAGLNAVDIFMIGQLGDVPVAAVGLANQINFLMFFVLFGIGSGAGVFAAQFWGKRELANIHKTLGIGLSMSLAGSLAFHHPGHWFPAGRYAHFHPGPGRDHRGQQLPAPGWYFLSPLSGHQQLQHDPPQHRVCAPADHDRCCSHFDQIIAQLRPDLWCFWTAAPGHHRRRDRHPNCPRVGMYCAGCSSPTGRNCPLPPA